MAGGETGGILRSFLPQTIPRCSTSCWAGDGGHSVVGIPSPRIPNSQPRAPPGGAGELSWPSLGGSACGGAGRKGLEGSPGERGHVGHTGRDGNTRRGMETRREGWKWRERDGNRERDMETRGEGWKWREGWKQRDGNREREMETGREGQKWREGWKWGERDGNGERDGHRHTRISCFPGFWGWAEPCLGVCAGPGHGGLCWEQLLQPGCASPAALL